MTNPFVQQSGLVSTGASLTSDMSLSGTTAGNTLIVPFNHANNSFNGTLITCAFSDGTHTFTLDASISRATTYTAGVFRLFNIPGGAVTVRLTSSSGTAANNFWHGNLIEYTPLAGLDAIGAAQNASSTGPVSVTTSSNLAQNVELAVVSAYAEAGTSGLTVPSGWTTRGLFSSTTGFADFVTASAAGAPLTANCGTLASAAGWDVAMATYSLMTAIGAAASAASAATGALSTGIQAAGSALLSVAAVAALTNWATVTLAGTQYTGVGGIHDPNFWLDVDPPVGSVLFYDATNITIYPNGEISSTTNNTSAVVQFFDGTAWSVGLVILTPNLVSYAHVLTAAAGALSTGVTLAGAALVTAQTAGNLSTAIELAGLALMIANAAAVLTTAVQLNAGALATVTASGALTGGVASLQGSASVLSSALGGLVTRIQAAGQVLIDSQATGSFSAQILFGGAATALSQANAQLTAAIQFAGNAQVVVTAAGAALIGSIFAGAANILSTGMGSLLTGLQIAGNALVTTTATGSLGTGITLSGAAVIDTASALKPVGIEGQYGAATINVLSPTGLPVALTALIQNSACIVSISYENAQGLPFVPNAISYRVDDVGSGVNLVPWTPLSAPAMSNAITITGAQNSMISLTHLSEFHQILFEITDGVGSVNFASSQYALIRAVGTN